MLRKPTSVAQKAPADYAQKIIKFITYAEQLRKKEKFKHVFGADETGIGAKDERILEARYGGVTKDNVINSFKACGIGASARR
ncbi:pogo transposable element with KRAB domain-like protein [Aphelenchoides avenae]|nr:pogo transposable element with KRAB domain-like protein [Aphelenchus avenae]